MRQHISPSPLETGRVKPNQTPRNAMQLSKSQIFTNFIHISFLSLSKSLERIIPPAPQLVPLVRHLAARRDPDAPVAHVLFPTVPSAVATPLLFVQRILGIAVLAVFLAIYKGFHSNGSNGVEEIVANHWRRQIVDIGVMIVDTPFCAYLSRIRVWPEVRVTRCRVP